MYATARHPGAGWPGAEALLWEEDCGTMNWFTGTAPVPAELVESNCRPFGCRQGGAFII